MKIELKGTITIKTLIAYLEACLSQNCAYDGVDLLIKVLKSLEEK